MVQLQHVVAVKNALAIRLHTRQVGNGGTGSQDDFSRFKFLDTTGGLHHHTAWAGQAPGALNHFHPRVFHEQINALGAFGGGKLPAFLNLGPVKGSTLHLDSECLRSLAAHLPYFRGVNKGLGGNATTKQTGSTQTIIFFDQGCFEAELGGASGCHITAGAGADDDEVEFP